MILVFVMVFPATLPMVVNATDTITAPEVCSCGCGNPEGACCCTAHRTTLLAMRCAGSSEPDAGSQQVTPPLGPLEPISIPLPEFSARNLVDLRLAFVECDPRPETPPPRT